MELVIFLAVFSFMIFICLLSSKISGWINMPCLLLFLVVGLLAGSEGIGKIEFDNATTANTIGSVAMAFILFSGGFDTPWSSVKKVLVSGGILSSLGVLLTAVFVGIPTYFFLQWFLLEMNISMAWCLLLGSIISSTDAAAVFSILRSRSVSLRGRLQPLLEFESGSNDPMAAFLTIFMVGVVGMETQTGETVKLMQYLSIFPSFLLKMSLGILLGYGIGKLAVKFYNKINFEYDGLYYVLAVVAVIFSFSLTELAQGNGFMAVYVTGMVLGNSKFIFHNGVGKFYEGVAWLMQVILFTMLGLLASPSQLWEAKWVGLFVAIFLMLVARPAAVFLGMIGTKFSMSERTLISWVGLRGGAPIMLATFPLMAAVADHSLMFHVVFFVVLASVLLQGMSIMPVARLLHLDSPLRNAPRNPVSIENTGSGDGTMTVNSREFTIPEILNGKKLSELNLPADTLVMVIQRNNNFEIPRGNSTLQCGDVLTIMGYDKGLEQVELIFG